MYRRMAMAMTAFLLAGCGSGPGESDIAKAVTALAASTPDFQGMTDMTISDRYCSEGNGGFACTATVTGGAKVFKVQIRMVEAAGAWKGEWLSPPTPM